MYASKKYVQAGSKVNYFNLVYLFSPAAVDSKPTGNICKKEGKSRGK